MANLREAHATKSGNKMRTDKGIKSGNIGHGQIFTMSDKNGKRSNKAISEAHTR